MEGRDTETTEGTANSYRSPKKPGRLQRRIPKNEKHEMEVEIENLVKAHKEAQSVAEIADREEPTCTQQRKQDNEQHASYAKEYVAKVEAGPQKICDDIFALMDKNLIPSARRITGAEGHQQRTPRRSSSLSKSILNKSQRSDKLAMKPRTTRNTCEAEWCIQEHAAQRKVVAVEEQQKLVKKSPEIQVEEKHVAEIKSKVQMVKNSLEVTNSSIKQIQMASVKGYRWMTSVRTTLTLRRRSRVNRNEHRDWCAI